ncbi:hypothetical protein B1C78_14520 [Thioalkalivibrio denitrificans]|uniref:MFS transporter n=2 Tax=Thioalkalivibrio denitrificans TaxID=108003 RepID=A0A1V3NCY7_9GAMM|nr:hypothetical protein B1C78_14520 [Thioalkalivibrio denitrificans]
MAGAASLAVAMGIGRFAFTPILPIMQVDFDLSLSDGGLIASANYLGYLIGAVSAAHRRIEAFRLFRTGLGVVVATTALMSVISSLPLWLLIRCLAGIGSAWVLVGATSLVIPRLRKAGRTSLNGIAFAGVGLGIAVAGLTCQALFLSGNHSAGAWLALTGLGLSFAVYAWRCVPRESGIGDPVLVTRNGRASAPHTATSMRDHSGIGRGTDNRRDIDYQPGRAQQLRARYMKELWDRFILFLRRHSVRAEQRADVRESAKVAPDALSGPPWWPLILAYGLFGYGYILPATFLPVYAREIVPDPASFGWIWPLFGVATVFSTVALGVLTRGARPRTAWALANLVMALGLVLLAMGTSVANVVICAICVGSTFMVITMLGMRVGESLGGIRARTLMAWMTAAFALGQLLGPMVFNGFIYSGLPTNYAFFTAAIGLVAASTMIAWSTVPGITLRGQSDEAK